MENLTCLQCQSAMDREERFCTRCGAPAPAPAVVSPQGEVIVGLIPQVVEVKGFLGLGTKFMTLVVTNRRLILAQQPEEMDEQHTEYEWKIEALIQEQGTTWRDFMESSDFSTAPWSRYQLLSPDAIQAEQPNNRSIPLDAIEELRLELYTEEDDHMDSLQLRTGGKLLDLSLPWGNGRTAQKILAGVTNLQVL